MATRIRRNRKAPQNRWEGRQEGLYQHRKSHFRSSNQRLCRRL